MGPRGEGVFMYVSGEVIYNRIFKKETAMGKMETLLSNQSLSKVFARLLNKMVQLTVMWSW